MGKINKRIRRADSQEEHRHMLPDGKMTDGVLHKPAKDQFDMHTHLYMHEGDVRETGPMHNVGDHAHALDEGGQTSGPAPMDKEPGKPWKSEL